MRADDREILRLGLPAMAGLAAEPIYSLTDTAFVGHLGAVELGAVAIGATAFTSSFWLFSFLMFGVTPRVARAVGAGDDEQAARIGVQALLLALLMGLLLTTVGFLFANAIVSVLGGKGEVGSMAETYLRIRVLSAPGVLVTLVGHGWLRGNQDTKTPMIVATVGAALNVLLDYVLIYPAGMGVAGAAWATVAGQAATGIVFFLVIRGRMPRMRWLPDPKLLRSLLRVGVDLMVRSGALVAGLTFALSMAARMSLVDLGAWQVTMQVFMVLALSLDSVAIASQAMIGKHLGAVDHHLARESSRRLMQWGLGLGVFLGLSLFFLRVPLASAFTDDPAITDLSAELLGWLALIQPLAAIAFTLDGILIGASDTRVLAITMIGSSAVFIAVSFVSLKIGVGAWGLAVGMSLWLAARSLSLGVRLRRGAWVLQP